jgi:hypothetical protein
MALPRYRSESPCEYVFAVSKAFTPCSYLNSVREAVTCVRAKRIYPSTLRPTNDNENRHMTSCVPRMILATLNSGSDLLDEL